MRVLASRCTRRSLILGLRARGRGIRSLGALREVYLAPENGVVFDGKTECSNITFDDAARAKLDPSGRDDIAL